jgi:hypothetical protein
VQMRLTVGALAAVLALPAAAQDGGWDSDRALELVARAQERRQVALADTGLVDYQADARGYVYFYLDRRDTGERTLVKTDQVALDVFWKAPDRAKQRIVGLRDARNLPTDIQYHEDHLTVVLDNFGDLIRLGDGDEVRDVLHPAAPAAASLYEYRLADSSSIRLPGAGEPVRVYQLQVRPRDVSRPAFVGTMFVDRRSGDIVRMEFTFTPVSYVDPQLDYINVRLENGLHKGRFWLPFQQQVELRRQLRELGLPAGGMIRGTMRISNYRFNQGLPDGVFVGRPVVSVPVEQRRAFPFEAPIDAELREVGLGGAAELGEVRRQAAELLGRRLLTGLPASRLELASASSTLRYNRAEGLALGAGFRTAPAERTALALRGGFAFGARHPFAEAAAWRGERPARTGLGLYLNQPRDAFSVGPVVSGAMNTLTALLAGYDFTDPFYASGGELRVEHPLAAGWEGEARARVERHRSARTTAKFSVLGGAEHFRRVEPVHQGTLLGGTLGARRRLPPEVGRGWGAGASLEGGRLAGEWQTFTYVRPMLDATYVVRSHGGAELLLEGSAGAALGREPRQAGFRVGGRGTVPGFDFRSLEGDRFAVARATASTDLVPRFVRGRLTAYAGGAWPEKDTAYGSPPAPQPLLPPRRTAASLGAGVGIFFDILRLDVARGIGRGGRWEVIVEASPAFWDFL